MELEMDDNETVKALEVALSCNALFDQYDDSDVIEQASVNCYENLYPNVV